MRITHLQPSNYRQMPWKNGKGITTEIARSPQDGDFDWRISVARVTSDGPFSNFPGYDRVILALEGAGMILTHQETGVVATLAALEPWSFRGEWTTTCVLRGEAFRDFNVITRREAFSAQVSVLVVGASDSIALTSATTILYCVSGNATAASVKIAHDEAVIVEHAPSLDESISVRPSAPTRFIRIDLSPAR